MKTLHIESKIQPYNILIGYQLRQAVGTYLPKKYSSILLITDSNVAELYAKEVMLALTSYNVHLEIIAAGEQSKNIDTFYHLQSKAIDYGLDRQSLIIALGGGVVGDLAGFVAATYMRGIDYIQMPTTILAHDSSIGGKVAINHERGKNLIGCFYPPVLVLYDTETLQTLPQQEIRSGYAELLKEALLTSEVSTRRHLSVSLDRILDEDMPALLEEGIRTKAEIVEQDEKELGKRKFLNLGHTLGHALETKLGYGNLTHGEAVAIGLLFSLYVSEKELQVKLPRELIMEWLIQNNYPLKISIEMIDDLIDIMKHDKKSVYNQIQMILLKEIGKPVIATLKEDKLRNYLSSFITTELKEVL
ncbi:3-dehydroquinate synthase [Ornithinibacillus californiensis]|uniref:3-dehydroquinate synthase n=1 Tax=Ornithinibacillus californiensis TaxID=161536 RepID=UPI00064D90B5|nr:3-dehydroquinate synthase [Ornithinibacillus californiensis]